MIPIKTLLFTLMSYAFLGILLVLLAVPLAICLLLPQKFLVTNPIFSAITQIFYWYCVRFSFLPITYKGLLHIPKEPCIIIANHQSSFDIPLIGLALANRPHIWLAWSELLKNPFLRIILPRVAVMVDTKSPMTGLRTLIQAINVVKEKPWDLIIFPEGERSTNGTVKEFFGGFVTIAQKIDRPVIPIKIVGVNKVYPPHTFLIYYHPISVIIGKPMHVKPGESDDDFKARVHAWYTQDAED